MFGFMGAGPDPRGMSCEKIIKGYKLNQELAKSRGGKHAKNSEIRVKELKPYYDQCTATQAARPVEEQAQEIQAIYDKIYGDSGTLLPGSSLAPAPKALVNYQSILLIAAIGLGAILYFGTKQKPGPKKGA